MPSKHGSVALIVLCIVALAGPPGVAADTHQSADFDVEITDANTTVTAGEPVVVTATVTNDGTETDSQQIHLKNVDDEIVDSVADPPLTLAPGETETVRLRWTTTAADIGNGTISVQSNTDFPKHEVTVESPPNVETTVESVDAEVTVGESVTVPVTVENTGEQATTSAVWLARNGTEVANRTVTVAADGTEQVNLTWTPGDEERGHWTLTAGTDASHTNQTVTVTQSSEPTDTETDESREAEGSSGGSSSPNVADRMHAPIMRDTATFAGGDIRRITFDTEIDGDVSATRFHDRPDAVDRAEDAVSYYGITVPDDAGSHNATIHFRLAERTLGTNDSQQVGVRHWNGTGWNTLATTVSNHSDGMEIAAETDGSTVGGTDESAVGDTDSSSVFAVTVGDSNVDAAAVTTADEESTTESAEETAEPNEGTASQVAGDPLTTTAGGVVLLFGVIGLLLGVRHQFREP